MIKINKKYVEEKIEAYNVAIAALELHSCDAESVHTVHYDKETADLAYKLRQQLIKKLNSEIDRWYKKVVTANPSLLEDDNDC